MSDLEENEEVSSQQSSYHLEEWRQMNERECEIQLEKDPTNN